ncbi:iron-regulated protein FrpC [Brucella melitensis]|nr:iron-regulated protein FrpC [Brucella melitensis]
MVAPWGHGSRCLLKGTLVTTPNGPVAVEKLGVGDLVTTVSGECLPIKWIGWQNYRAGEADWNESVMRSASDAMRWTAGHRIVIFIFRPTMALFIDGVLIFA